MKNIVYLMLDEKKDFALFKVGFTSNLVQRLSQYTTHNPLTRAIDTVVTYGKTKRTVENKFHEEVKKRGYDFVVATADGKTTEWFKVEYTDKFYNELKEKGLRAFDIGKNRKSSGEVKAD